MESAPVFILGLHRSGTTLLYQMLAAGGVFNIVTARHVICFDELGDSVLDKGQSRERLRDRLERLGVSNRKVDVVPLGPDTPEEYGFILDNLHAGPWITRRHAHVFHRVCSIIQQDCGGGRRLLVKNPWDFGHERRIRALVPGARFVYIHRNPLHLLSSRYRVLMTALSHGQPYLRLLNHRYDRLVRSEFGWRFVNAVCAHTPELIVRWVLEQTAWFTRRYLRATSADDDGVRVEIRFEDLCARPDETIRRVLRFLDVDGGDLDYAAMIGPHASSALPPLTARGDEIVCKLGRYARAVGYDLPAIVRECRAEGTSEVRVPVAGASL